VDFGGTNLRVSLIEQSGPSGLKIRIVDHLQCSTVQATTPHGFVSKVTEFTGLLIKRNRLQKRNLKGVGVGVPGPVHVDTGMIYFLPNVPGWKNVRLRSLLQRRLGLRVRINNDGNAMAQGEFMFGNARGSINAVFLTLGTGIGCGLLINGKLHHGQGFSACELGHMRFRENGVRCGCGSTGCIETELGNAHLLKKLKKSLSQCGDKTFKDIIKKSPGKKVQLHMVDIAAKRGSKCAKDFWKDAGQILGNFLGGVCNLLNPEVIVIGGGVSKAGHFLFNPLKQSLKRHVFPVAYRGLSIRQAKFGADAGVIGAASLVFAS